MRLSWIIWVDSSDHKGPYKREAEEVRVREAVMTKAGAILRNKRFEDATLLALSPKGPGNKECKWLSDTRKTKRIDSSPEPAQGTRPCTHLDFNSNWLQTYALQNCKRIHLCPYGNCYSSNRKVIHWGTESLRNLPKVTQLPKSKADVNAGSINACKSTLWS